MNLHYAEMDMTYEQYLTKIPVKPDSVKAKILKKLWDQGKKFPRGWVSSKDLLDLTGQKYFDRRVRELRDENGCDIQTGIEGGFHAYRLVSTGILIHNRRKYLTGSQKKELFESTNYCCSVCDRQFEQGSNGLQADHRKPAIRGGTDAMDNWQPLCVECNVGKRRACSKCELDCEVCSWAFPDKSGRRLLVKVPLKLETSLKNYAVKAGKTVDLWVCEAVAEYVTSRK